MTMRGWRKAGWGNEPPKLGPRTDRLDIAASEIAEFSFCPRAWWLRRHGVGAETPRSRAGRAAHARVGAALAQMQLLRRLVWATLMVAGAIVIGVSIAQLR